MKNENFSFLVKFLRKCGYTVCVRARPQMGINGNYSKTTYREAFVSGGNIRGCFCDPVPQVLGCHCELEGKIAVDHEDCFDKWKHCPLIVKLPTTDIQLSQLLRDLWYIGSNKGLKFSRKFGVLRKHK